jgi:hypothetical protein
MWPAGHALKTPDLEQATTVLCSVRKLLKNNEQQQRPFVKEAFISTSALETKSSL